MVGRIVDLLKCACLGLALLNVTWAIGCGDGAKVENTEPSSGGPDDPAANPGGDAAP